MFSGITALLPLAGVPGQSIGVVRLNSGSVEVEFSTWGQYTEDGDLVVPEAFTAVTVGILMDDFLNGRNVTALPNGLQTFNWETKVQDLFPGDTVWELQDQWSTEKANVADTLSHVAGLTGHDFMYMSDDTPATLAPRFRYLRQNFELRQQYSYNSIMYILAAHVIETYSAKSFADFVKERIFEPLDMVSTAFDVEEALSSGTMSQGWASTNGRRIPLWLTEEMSTRLVGGAGGIMSNAVDMTKWAGMLLNGGVDPYTNKTIVPAWIFDATTTARTIVAGNVTGPPQIPSRSIIGYGLGWARLSYQGHDILTHDGGVPGFLTTVMVLPEDNLAIVSFVNADGPDSISELLPFAIIESTLGLNNTIQSEAGAFTGSNSSSADSTPSPSSTSNCTAPKVPTAQFAGTYTSGGYGNITFCAPNTNNTDADAGTSAYCNGTLADFASLGPLDANTLYARSPRIASHFSMERACDSDSSGTADFVIRPLSIYPHGYGKNTTAFAEQGGSQLPPGWHVKCVVDGDGQSAKGVTAVGYGWMDIEDGQWTKPSQGTMQNLADVWWDKV
ncbi:hypothetical protein GSI_12133 [Ganoderma sinense ZZ0214-1]|uniref:Beta-lactamase-related domain-containing protein n=1 Tax=Ganoderma sinense ZZ0214-1 TaxID=1077348 RepID=A0A2G8RY13_9APHY|nr:hypothetical protein GSI_12133 [Ganoderma sinense ZZ0214-1]